MFEEVAKSGLDNWRGALRHFLLASTVRSYAASSLRFLALFDAACTADHVGPNTESALLLAAEHAEHQRKAVIEACVLSRHALKGWFGRYPHFSPWAPEQHEDFTPDWGALEQVEQDVHNEGSATLE